MWIVVLRSGLDGWLSSVVLDEVSSFVFGLEVASLYLLSKSQRCSGL